MYTGNVRGMFFNSEELRKAAKKSRRQKRVVALKNPANDAVRYLSQMNDETNPTFRRYGKEEWEEINK